MIDPVGGGGAGAAGALDIKTQELTSTVLSTLHGGRYGAISHAIAGMRLGLTLPQIAEDNEPPVTP